MQIDTSKTHLSYHETHRTMRIQTAILDVTKLHRANIYAVGQTFFHETLLRQLESTQRIFYLCSEENDRIIQV